MKKVLFFTIFISAVLNSYSSVAIVNGLSHYYKNLSGGDTFEGVITLVNSGENVQRVRVYFNDYLRDCDNSSFYDSEDFEGSIYKWFSLSRNDFEIAPGATMDVNFKVNIPSDYNSKGSKWQFIMVETDKSVEQKVKSNLNVTSKVRYGVNVGLSFGIDHISDFAVHKELELSSDNSILFTMKNNDSYFHDTEITLEFYSLNGELIFTKKLDKRIFFPKSCSEFKFDTTDLISNDYDVIIYCDSGYNINAFRRKLTL